MLKFSELEKMVEYYILTDTLRTKVRINKNGEFERHMKNGVWVMDTSSYNFLINSTFEPCEWVPKIEEIYFFPDFTTLYADGERYLAGHCIFTNDSDDKRVKKNVGWYKTPKEAHAKSLEMGWTL